MRRFIAIGSIVLAAVLALLVSAMNSSRVEIELAFARFMSPLGLTLVFVFTIGLVVGLLTRVFWVAELLNERGRLRRALRLAESTARTNSIASRKGE